MMKLHSVEVKTLTPEIFRMFQVNTALLTAGDEKHLNTMTIGWGQLGTLWNLPVCTVYVRPERYTYAFMEAPDTFSVSVLPDSASYGEKGGWHRIYTGEVLEAYCKS